MASLRDFLPPVKDTTLGESAALKAKGVGTVSLQGTSIVGATPSAQHGITSTLTLASDASGQPDFTAVVKQGENASKYVHATRTSLVEKPRSAVSLAFPSEEEALETERRTRDAIRKLLEGKQKVVQQGGDDEPKYIKYTPVSGTRTRIVKMVSAQSDPMEPPRFHHKKAPHNPPSPPVPVLHSPERKLTKEEVEAWKIPPVVSNWKNARGYTVPLDKRLAARGVQQLPELSSRLDNFADALYRAERQARTDVEKRAQLQRAVSLRQKEEKEAQLRELAQRARAQRSDGASASSVGARRIDESPPRPPPTPLSHISREDDVPPPLPPSPPSVSQVSLASTKPRRKRSRFDIGPGGVRMPEPKPVEASNTSGERDWRLEEDDDAGLRERDAIRRERREQREREMRARENHGGYGPMLKRSKLTRDQDRDVAERVALGQGAGASGGTGTGEVMYDQRLFNQGERDAGRSFGAGDGYNIYDRPLWADRPGSSFLYRPKDATLGNQSVARRGAAAGQGGGDRRGDRPVEFERDVAGTEASTGDGDPYGINRFFTEAKRGAGSGSKAGERK